MCSNGGFRQQDVCSLNCNPLKYIPGTTHHCVSAHLTAPHVHPLHHDTDSIQRQPARGRNPLLTIQRVPLPSLRYLARTKKWAGKIIDDPTHPGHNLFELLPSGSHYRSLFARASRHKNSFFATVFALLNSLSAIQHALNSSSPTFTTVLTTAPSSMVTMHLSMLQLNVCICIYVA